MIKCACPSLIVMSYSIFMFDSILIRVRALVKNCIKSFNFRVYIGEEKGTGEEGFVRELNQA